MPVYEYKREDGTVFEHFQLMEEEPLKVCPETGQPVKRLISGGIQTHIKGWSPDKQRRKEKWIKENPYGTTLPEYDKKIKENTEKALEEEAKLKKKNS